jgi:hypothetical protein
MASPYSLVAIADKECTYFEQEFEADHSHSIAPTQGGE